MLYGICKLSFSVSLKSNGDIEADQRDWVNMYKYAYY